MNCSGVRITKAEHVRTRTIDGEVVLFSQAAGEIVVLNEVGSSIFAAIGDGAQIGEIVDAVAAQYEVDHSLLAVDVREFLAELAEAGVVIFADGE